MALLSETLAGWLKGMIAEELPGEDPGPVSVVPATQPEFGDYQCNDCMRLARRLRRAPRDLAEALRRRAGTPPFLSALEVAGPGFLNITLAPGWVAEQAAALASDPRLGIPDAGGGKTVVLDYGSPNITKPLHIGHLRSHNIGAALDRLLRCAGYRVIADNHLGDWGTQFGITILGYREFGDPERMRAAPLEELERVYVLSHARGKEDPAWKDRCREELVKLQRGDPVNLALWRDFTRWSIEELERTYRRLGIRYDLVRGESHYRDKMPAAVERLAALGLTRVSEGATVVDLDEEKLPLAIVRKSDGGYNYAASDIATVLSRVEEFAPERIVYVTDERQQLHFRQVFAISRRLGVRTRLEHVWFGLMRMPEGTISTREGNAIRLETLLDRAEELALRVVREASPDMPADEQARVARAVGIGAVKYADLSQNPQSVVTFTFEKALALEGNSGPYLQYACARIASVRDKYAARFPGRDPEGFPLRLAEPVEKELGVKLLRFPDAVIAAAESSRPNAVSDYLYDLAQTYSRYYQTVPFLQAEEGVRESRVRLCGAVAAVLRRGLELLGLETPARI